MAGDVLASKYVEFVARGLSEIQAQMDKFKESMEKTAQANDLLRQHLKDGTYLALQKQLQGVNREYEKLRRVARLQDLIAEHGKLAGSMLGLQERMQGITRIAGVTFAALTAGTMGWIRSGMAGTVEGNRLTMAFQLLGREVAGTFKPAIDRVTNSLYRIVNWFQSLTRNQQENIRTGVLWVAGISGAVLAVNLAIGVYARLAASLQTVAAWFGIAGNSAAVANAKMTGGGLAGLLRSPLGKLGIAGAAVYGVNEMARDGDKPTWLDRTSSTVWEGLKHAGRNTVGSIFYDSAERKQMNQEGYARTRAIQEGREYVPPSNKPNNDRSQVTLSQVGREGFADTYDRLTDALLQVDANTSQERTAKALEEIKGMVSEFIAIATGAARKASQTPPE